MNGGEFCGIMEKAARRSVPKIAEAFTMSVRFRVFVPILLALVLGCALAGCTEESDEPNVDTIKSRLAAKHRLDPDELTLVEFMPQHNEQSGRGVWFETVPNPVPDCAKFRYRGTIVTVYGEHDDFLYDELVQATADYCAASLGVEVAAVDVDGAIGEGEITRVSGAYASFLYNNDVPVVDERTVASLLAQEGRATVYVEVDPDADVEAEVARIQDVLSTGDFSAVDVDVRLFTSLAGVMTYREPTNWAMFDYYCIEGVDYDRQVARIERIP